MSSPGSNFEQVEVPVEKKIELNITIDGLLDALAQHASSLANSAGPQEAEKAAQLKQFSQLASQLKGKMGGPGLRTLPLNPPGGPARPPAAG